MALSPQQQLSLLVDDGLGFLPGYAEYMAGALGLFTGHFDFRTFLAGGISDRLDATPSGDVVSVFSAFAPTTSGDSVYNANLWGGDGAALFPNGFLGVVWYSDNAATIANGTAITARHVITPQHGRHDTGDTIRWILADGTFVDRTIIDRIDWAGDRGAFDIFISFCVFLLDTDLPATVPILRLLHPDVAGDLDLTGLLFVQTDAENKAHVAQIYSATESLFFSIPSDATPALYWETLISGDSGSPFFLVFGNTLIYISGAVTSFAGPNALVAIDAIAAAIDTLNARNTGTNLTPNYLNVDQAFIPDVDVSSPPVGQRMHLGLGLSL